MPVHPAPYGLFHQIGHLGRADLHVRQPLARQQQPGGHGLGLLLPTLPKFLGITGCVQHRGDRRGPVVLRQELICAEGHGKTVQQVIPHGTLLRVVGGQQQAAAGVAGADAFPLNAVATIAHRLQQQVDDGVVQQVQLIEIEHPPMGLGQQSRLEHRLPAAEGGAHVHGAQEPILGHANGNLHKGGRHHLGGQLLGRCSSPALTGCGVPIVGIVGVAVEAAPQNFNGGEQGMEPPRQHRFARATAPGDDHAPQAGIHGRQQESQLDGVMARDGSQGKSLPRHHAHTSERSRAGVAGNHGEEVMVVSNCRTPTMAELVIPPGCRGCGCATWAWLCSFGLQ